MHASFLFIFFVIASQKAEGIDWLVTQPRTKRLLKNLGQMQCAKVLKCYSWNQSFSKTHLHLFLQTSYFSHPSKKSFEQRKKMTFNHRLANITTPLVRGLYCPSSQSLIKKALHEITVVKAILKYFFSCHSILSSAPTAHHYITKHLSIGDEHFLARLMPFFNVQWDIFSKCHKL